MPPAPMFRSFADALSTATVKGQQVAVRSIVVSSADGARIFALGHLRPSGDGRAAFSAQAVSPQPAEHCPIKQQQDRWPPEKGDGGERGARRRKCPSQRLPEGDHQHRRDLRPEIERAVLARKSSHQNDQAQPRTHRETDRQPVAGRGRPRAERGNGPRKVPRRSGPGAAMNSTLKGHVHGRVYATLIPDRLRERLPKNKIP